MTADHPRRDLLLFHLASQPGMGPVGFRKLLSAYGTVENVLSASVQDLVEKGRIQRKLAETIVSNRDRLDGSAEQMDLLGSMGGVVWHIDSESVPARLSERSEEWHFLTLLGNLNLLEQNPIVGIVGRRRATPEGRQFAHDLASELARRGIVTLSGMARGIDRAAHLGSLNRPGGTIGLLAEGMAMFLREPTPFRNAARPGDETFLLLVSGAAPYRKWSISEAMRRNTWIASWSDILVVVEAGEKGGTWKTAREAVCRGKTVWVATGFDSPESGTGNESILRDLDGRPLSVMDSIDRVADRILRRWESERIRNETVVPAGRSFPGPRGERGGNGG